MACVDPDLALTRLDVNAVGTVQFNGMLNIPEFHCVGLTLKDKVLEATHPLLGQLTLDRSALERLFVDSKDAEPLEEPE